MIDFPSSPSVGQVFNSLTGPVYIWDGTAWSLVANTTPAFAATHDWLKDLITTRTSTVRITVGTGKIFGNGVLAQNFANLAKDINATWVAGNNVGGMESGFSLTASTTYFLHALYNPLTGAFDWMYSPNLTITTLPSGYIWVGRFWTVYVNASSQIVDYAQSGNSCYMSLVSWFATSSAIAPALYTAPVANPVPNKISVDVFVVGDTTVNGNGALNFNVFDAVTVLLGGGGRGIRLYEGLVGAAISNQGSGTGLARSNVSRQLFVSTAVAGTAGTMTLYTSGWDDFTLNRVY